MSRVLAQFGSRVHKWLHTEKSALPPHEGETPQPAAESGWREELQGYVGWLLNHAEWLKKNLDYMESEINKLRDLAALIDSLLPVVQTRPEG